ncbi:MAG: Tn3 family transposase [Sulfuricurvum sp.]|jgi:TnpA family transposase|nr:Tn3 family transposase [Sulfuricurvum sp.]
MPLIQIFSYSQKKEFETPPVLDNDIRNEVFALPDLLQRELENFESDANRTFFIALYGYFKLTRIFYEPGAIMPEDIAYIQSRYLFEPCTLNPPHIKTRIRYKRLIRDHFGYQSPDGILQQKLIDAANKFITQLPTPKALFYALVELAVGYRYEVPSYTFLSKIITDAMNHRRNDIFGRLKSYSAHAALQPLELLIQTDETLPGRYVLSRFKKFSHSLKPSKIKEEVHTFETIRNIHSSLSTIICDIGLEENTARHYAQWVEKSDMHQILRKAKHKWQFDLICFVVHQTRMRSDQLCDILVQSVQSAKLSALREHQNVYFLQRQSRSKASAEIADLVKNSLIPKLHSIQKTIASNIDTEEKIRLIGEQVEAMIADEEEKKPYLETHEELEDHTGYHAILEIRSRKLQNRVSDIIKALEFDEKESDKSLMKAITHFRTTGANITTKLPMEFLGEEERNSLLQSSTDEPFRISLYKMFLFIAIADGIKAGSLNLKHSYRYRAFNDYLINMEEYHQFKADYLKQHHMESLHTHENILKDLKGELDGIYRSVNSNIVKGINSFFHARGDGSYMVHTPKLEKKEEDEGIGIYLPKEKFTPLIDVLRQIDRLSIYSAKFLHHTRTLHHRSPKSNALYASIIGYGCNISIPKMAKISKGISAHDIDHIRTWYLSPDMLQEANDAVLAFTESLDVPMLFRSNPHKNHTASDGQKFNLSVDSLNSGHSFKYFGLGRGSTRYTFSDESGRLFYTTVINASEREAAYVIDGLMHQEVIQSDIHSTDTFGYSEIIFALTHLLGFMFAPRIKNFKDQQLYAFEPKKLYRDNGYTLLPVKQINSQIIEEQWEQILRLVLTIKERRVSASQLLKRLTSYSRKHKLYQALREFGRIIKTRFLLTYIDDVSLRQQIEKQLNKVENANKFSRAVFFGNSGEYFYATKEEQDIASNALRLIQNSIICWNYLYFSNLLTKEKDPEQQSKIVNALKNGSIVHWQHINFYGEYDFTEKPIEDEFDMEAIKALSV